MGAKKKSKTKHGVSAPTADELELEKLRQENAELKERVANGSPDGLTYKVGQKGGVSVYGLGRFPVTLYKEQWFVLLDAKDDIIEFIELNKAKLKEKN